MEFKLRPARRGSLYTRCLIFSASGQGKTFTALAVAFHLAELYGLDPSTIAVGDTETVESADDPDEGQGSAEKYDGRPCNCNRCHRQGLVFSGFQTMILEQGYRDPDSYIRFLQVCAQSGIKIVIIDGITDEWRSLLQIVDKVREQSGGKEDGWSVARPLHNQFVKAVMDYPGHIIVTCRAKPESRHRKAEHGMGDVLPDQDSNVVYDYDVAVFMKRGHAHVVKTRDDRLETFSSRHPGLDLAEGLKRWCDDPRAHTQSAIATHAQQADPLPTVSPNTRTDVCDLPPEFRAAYGRNMERMIELGLENEAKLAAQFIKDFGHSPAHRRAILQKQLELIERTEKQGVGDPTPQAEEDPPAHYDEGEPADDFDEAEFAGMEAPA